MEQNEHLTPSQEPNPLSGALSSLLSNPEMMERIRSIAGQFSKDASPVDTPATPPPTSAPIGVPADGLASVLENPELMAKLPQIMSMLGPMLSTPTVGVGSPASPRPPRRSPEDCRNDLLLALKPFLSPERCRAIDTLLRISRLGNVLRQMK